MPQPKSQQAFITIDNTRIRLSNIKEYKAVIEESKHFDTPLGKMSDAAVSKAGLLGIAGLVFGVVKSQVTEEKILRIKTFQNQTFSFSEKTCDVQSALKKLDNYFGAHEI